MATYYEILGLDDHPLDLKTAKRAYAKKLRVTRPDDDPEGFMKLREALNRAKNEIAWRDHDAAHNSPEIDTPEVISTEQTDHVPDEVGDAVEPSIAETADVNLSPEALEALLVTPEPDPAPVTEDVELTGDQILMSRFSKAFNDPFLKSDKAHWNRLLDEKTELSIDEHLDFEERFRGALINAYNQWIEDKKEKPNTRRPLSSAIENLIFDKMEWRFLQDTESYKSNEVNWLKGQFDLFNRPAPREIQQAREQRQEQAQFEDDNISAPMMLWRIIRVILIFIVLSNIFKLFGA